MTKLSLIIPSYNESDNLVYLFDKLIKSFADVEDVEIIIVDNGSTDNTSDVLESLLKKSSLPFLKSIRLLRNTKYEYCDLIVF